jgi:RHS repeat-associated protein
MIQKVARGLLGLAMGAFVSGAIGSVAITPPNLTGGIAGTVSGAAAVGPDGSSQYRIELPVPPGTADVVPQLALQYTSKAPATLSGLGWSVSGLSEITRCAQTLGTDGATKVVSNTAIDVYCLDGQRLILVSGTLGGAAEFRTEVDGFSRIKSVGSSPANGPDSWTVETKAGLILTYGGNSGNATLVAPGGAVNLSWSIAFSKDRHGNYVSYQYETPDGTGEHFITRVRYTGNDSAGLVAYNAVNFLYESTARLDPYAGYTAGVAISHMHRLQTIETRTATASDGSAGTLIQLWTLAYTTSAVSGRSLLQTVTNCDANNHCLTPTRFTWTARDAAANVFGAAGSGVWGGPSGFSFSTATTTYGSTSDQILAKILPVDFNGDGKADLISSDGTGAWQLCASTGTTFSCSTVTGMPAVDSRYFEVGDFNGDGKTDIYIPGASTIGQLCLSNGASFSCQNVTIPNPQGTKSPAAYLSADMNGDGYDDLVVLPSKSTDGYICLYVGGTQGFSCSDVGAAGLTLSTSVPSDSYISRPQRLLGDFNGDGIADIAQYTNYATGTMGQDINDHVLFQLRLGSSTGFVSTTSVPDFPRFSAMPGGNLLGDINGDGYLDVSWSGPGTINSTTAVLYASTCYFTGVALGCAYHEIDDLTSDLGVVLDIDSYDGTDVPTVLGDKGSHRILPSGQPTGMVVWSGTREPVCSNIAGIVRADFNGDGTLDSACYDSVAKTWTVTLAGSSSFPDLIKTVTDGNGLVSAFTYKSLSDSSVYTNGTGAAYPMKDVHGGSPVVSQLSVDAASGVTSGATLSTMYTYTGNRMNVLRRVSLGFETITATDVATGVSTKTTYSQVFPTVGLSIGFEKRAKSGTQLLSSRANTLASFSTVSGSYYPYVRASKTTSYDLDGTALPTVQMQVGTAAIVSDGIDQYGNVTSQVDTVTNGSDVFGTTTTSVFSNDSSSWLIGQLTDVQITKTAPSVPAVMREVSFAYNSYGQLSSQTTQPGTAALALTTTFTRDASFGVMTQESQSWIDPITSTALTRAISTSNFTDAAYRYASSITNAASQATSYTYDPATGLPLTATDANGLTTVYAYDGFGRKTRISLPDGTASTWSYRLCVDTCGYGSTAKSVVITQRWATLSGVDQQSTVPWEAFYDVNGRLVMKRSWDYAGNATYQDWVYDASGHLAQKSIPQTAAARLAGTYGWTYYSGYDALNRVGTITTTKKTGSGVDTTTLLYSGLTTTTTDPNDHTTKQLLNGLGKIKQVTDGLSHVTSYVYDPFGGVVQTADSSGNVNSFVLDALGRRTQQVDKDLGTWTYVVDAAGRVRQQKDAKAQVTTMTYDLLNRMTERSEPDLDSRWAYDTAMTGVGQLAEAYTWIASTSTKDYRRVYTYDSLGRSSAVTTSLDWDYTSLTTYDTYGRPATLTNRRSAVGSANVSFNPTIVPMVPISIDDLTIFIPGKSPTGAPQVSGVAQVQYTLGYNNQGNVSSVVRGGTTLWTLNAQDAVGRRTLETFASGLETATGYNAYTARLTSIQTGASNGAGGVTATIQNDSYDYDPVGNVLTRSWLPATSAAVASETFTYDELNRLHTSAVSGVDAQTFNYDALGNISSKTNVGTYTYPAAGSALPHMVTSITGTVSGLTNPSFGYDANGNTVSGLNRLYTWSAANLPLTIDKLTSGTAATATQRYEFLYGPERQRTRQIIRAMSGTTVGAAQRTIYTAGAIEKEINATAGTTTIRTYLPLGLGFTEETFTGTAINAALQVTPVERYFHKDHLGSLVIVTDVSGVVTERLAYDAWGRRRPSNGIEVGWQLLGDSSATNTLDHTGYTGQTQLDDLGLVHLNGRVYDPVTGRMTSPDPTIPSLYDAQSLNRASYVLNSPLGYTDPTGFDWACDAWNCTTIGSKTVAPILEAHAGLAAGALAFGGLLLRSPAISVVARGVFIGAAPFVGPAILVVVTAGVVIATGYQVYQIVEGIKSESANNPAPVSETPSGSNATSPQTPPPEDDKNKRGETEHGKQRAEEAKTDPNRNVGDKNKVIRDGKEYIDDLTGNKVHVLGDNVVVLDDEGNVLSQFKNSRANTNWRVETGRWIPVSPSGF